MSAPARDLWVFGYGSLMWRPGFAYAEARRGRLIGYRRSFCIYSVHHRGTPQRPGMVLGLDRGGACEGIAFRVVAANAAATRRYLREREQVYGVYRGISVAIELIEGPRREVLALTHIAEPSHPNYARLAPMLQAQLIRGGKGISGANLDYLANTLRHLAELGIRERQLERLLVMVGPHALRRAGGEGISAAAANMVAAQRWRPAPDLALDRRCRFAYRLCLD